MGQELKKDKPNFSAKNQVIKEKNLKEKETKTVTENEIVVSKTKIDSLKPKKGVLESKVKYTAKEYARFDQKKKLLTLYDKAELFYEDYELKSGKIVFDYEKNEVYAGRLKDSAGNYTQFPYFKQGTNVIEPDSIRFNYKTKKAVVWNSRTEQGELRIKSEKTKKENDSVYFMKGSKLTTSKNLEDPEYYFYTTKLKFVPKKKVVVGPTTFVIAGVPTPLVLPFAFFPVTETNRSGIIIPSYGQSVQRGYSLQGLGYYFALSDNYDLTINGDYYTNGSYTLAGSTNYAKKYKFNGTFNVRFENLINEERGYPSYFKQKNYNIQWSHTKDQKSNPNNRFSASVNLGSSQYFANSINVANVGSNFNNTLSSSISFSKTINVIPQINFSLSATHSQNTKTKTVSLTLPTFTASVDRIFPFAMDGSSKKGIIKNINFQYSVQGQNSIETTDELFFTKKMFDGSLTTMKHTIPISTNYKLFKYFSATSSANFNENWTLQTVKKFTDFSAPVPLGNLVSERVNGFDSFRTYDFSNSLTTTIYGTVNLKGKGRIKSIRHVMSPSISHSYAPSFEKYYTRYETATGFDEYSRFEGAGSPNKTYSSSVGLSLSNTFEAKITDKDSTKTELKKIKLLNSLNFSTSYNIAGGRWSTIGITGSTLLFKDKMNVTFGASLNPYADIDLLTNERYSNPFSVSDARLSFNYALTSSKDDSKKNATQTERNGGRNDGLYGENTLNTNNEFSKEEEKEDEFAGFYKALLPWDINLSYSLTYSNTRGKSEITSNSVSFNSNLELTPKWKIGVASGYDFVNKGINNAQLRFDRDLLSWRMSVNWQPIGDRGYWGFFIGVKAGIFQDIKYDKQTQPDRILR